MITARLVGDTETILSLRALSISIRGALREAVTRSAVALTAYVKDRKLSGSPLHNRTGTLRRKINYTINETDAEIVASVGVKLSYAAAHEYGFDGMVTIREHTRLVTQAFGRDIVPVEATVREHAAHMHLPERSFLRSSLAENTPTILAQLEQAVSESIAK